MSIRRDRATALCVVDPARAIAAIADAIGRESRRELLELVVSAWVDAVPERELARHYAKALAGLAHEDLRELAGWPGSSGLAVAVANREFLLAAFAGLADGRREALRLAACLRASAAFDAGVSEGHVIATVLPCLSRPQLDELARGCTALYLDDRLGGEN